MVTLSKIIDGLEMVDDIVDCYYNLEKDEIFLSNIGEYGDLTEDEIDELFEESIILPTQYEINEYQIMVDFIETIESPEINNNLQRLIQGKGAFRRFKDYCIEMDIIQDWYKYRDKEYKKITNFKQTKEILNNMKLELPDIPDITDININRLSKKRDEKILEEIIKPKDNVIQNLYQDNMNLHRQLSRKAQLIEKAEKYEKERDNIIADNEKLHDEVDNIKTEYNKKEFEMKCKYTNRINKLEKENNFLHKVVDRFKETIDIFITWICKKFDMGAENNLIRDFERENNILLDAEKQIKHEEREKDLEMEI